MFILRSAHTSDHAKLKELASSAGPGLVNLPNTDEKIAQHLKIADDSFHSSLERTDWQRYFFMLEDQMSGKILGCCAVDAKGHDYDAGCYFRLAKEPLNSLLPPLSNERLLLIAECGADHLSEMCSLFLSAELRGKHLGKLMTKGRLLFIAKHKARFTKQISSSLRGVFDADGNSLFWQAVGKPLFNMNCEELFNLSAQEQRWLADAIPAFPIYTSLLPSAVQEAINHTHPNTVRALNMLLDEGFERTDTICFDDGGPKVIAEMKEIKTVKNCQTKPLVAIIDEAPSTSYVVANGTLDFRATYGNIKEVDDGVLLPKAIVDALEISINDPVTYIPV